MSSLFENFKKMDIVSAQKSNVQFEDQSSKHDIIFQKPSNLSPTIFYEFLMKNKDVLVEATLASGYAPKEEIEKEWNMAVDMIKYVEGLKLKSLHAITPIMRASDSLFQFLLDVYIICFSDNVAMCRTIPHLKNVVKAIASHLKLDETKILKSFGTVCNTPGYTTAIITENADIHSAVDEVVKQFKNLRKPWIIQRVLVQENIKDKFLALLKQRLPRIDPIYSSQSEIVQNFELRIKEFKEKGIKLIQPSNDDILKATIAVGTPMLEMKLKNVPIIVFDTFRTHKEAVALFNKQDIKEFASIWSENITEAFEYVKCLTTGTVWVNCHGVFDSRCAFIIHGYKYYLKNANILAVEETTEDIELFPEKAGTSYEQAFFSGEYFFTVLNEKLNNPKNYAYKTTVVRYGQTFAN